MVAHTLDSSIREAEVGISQVDSLVYRASCRRVKLRPWRKTLKTESWCFLWMRGACSSSSKQKNLLALATWLYKDSRKGLWSLPLWLRKATKARYMSGSFLCRGPEWSFHEDWIVLEIPKLLEKPALLRSWCLFALSQHPETNTWWTSFEFLSEWVFGLWARSGHKMCFLIIPIFLKI